MTAWAVYGVELPFGHDDREWWIDSTGRLTEVAIADAELLPGSYVLQGLVDAHAHPALAAGQAGPIALDRGAARANLIEWARAGVTLIRDTGSPGGISLELAPEPGMPVLRAAGRFMAPSGRYFPELLVEPVEEEDLVTAALAEISKGATWIKVIADFPDLTAGTPPEATYHLQAITELTQAAHSAGARVAAHSTTHFATELISAGVDSIEHGTGLGEEAIREMAQRGTAWTPTLAATLAMVPPEAPDELRQHIAEARERLSQLLPLAASLGVPVLAGTDVAGTLPQEVALLSQLGLAPDQALAAASTWPRQYLGAAESTDIVTYRHDPRDDQEELANPAAVVVGGVRVR